MTDSTRKALSDNLDNVTDIIGQIVKAHQEDSDTYGQDGEDGDIYEFPLEVVAERGRPYTVVIGTGGPHIEVTADGWGSAELHGYWGGEHIVRSGDVFSDFLDIYIDRDSNE